MRFGLLDNWWKRIPFNASSLGRVESVPQIIEIHKDDAHT